jgi:3-(methylthio)propanoyl-CoA dehydrogenase
MMQLLAQIEAEIGAASGSNAVCYEALSGVRLLREATGKLLELGAADVDKALAVAVPYLMLCGFVLGGWLMARAAKLVSIDPAPADREFSASKRASARAYVEQLLPRALGYARMVTNGSASIAGVDAALI